MVVGRVFQDLPEQQGILHQPAAWDVQEVPEVQLPAEGRLEAALQEVLHPPVLLLLVQQGLGLHLIAAVRRVGGETGQLWGQADGRLVAMETRRMGKITSTLLVVTLGDLLVTNVTD